MSFGSGQALATLRSNTTAEQDAAQRKQNGQTDTGIGPYATPTTTINDYKAALAQYQGFPVAPPADNPDITDELLQRTRTSFAQRLQMGNNRASSFAGTQLGGSTLSKPVLGGY